MLKKITEPQALYQKSGSVVDAKTTTVNTTTNKATVMKKKTNWKLLGSILIIAIVAIAGIAGILISQRQSIVEGPVAPNAPSSQPEAAGNQIPEPDQRQVCSIGFEVKPVVVTPGSATCISKTAKIAGTTTILTANTKVAPGTVIEYSITVAGTGTSNSTVEVSDKLPAELQYVTASAKLNGTQNAPATIPGASNGNTLKYNLGGPAASKQNVITYQATLKGTTPATVTSFTNAVTVVSNPNTATAKTDTSCKLTLGVQPPVVPTGVAKCESKFAYNTATTPSSKYTTTGTTVSMVKRGDIIEYQISISAEKTTKGAVVVTDTLPAELDYVANSSSWKGTVPPTGTGKVITFNLGVMAQDGKKQTILIKYKAKVKPDAQIKSFANAVKVVTNGEAATADNTCKATLKVAPVGVAQCVQKTVTDSAGAVIAENTTVTKGNIISYKIKVAATETTTGPIVVTDVLPASVTYDSAVSTGITYTAATRTVTANLGVMGDTAANKEKTIEFKVKINDNAVPGDFTNTASVTTSGANADTCPVTLRIAYACNVGCSTDDQCKSIGSGYICSTENGNTCRLAENPSSSSCGGVTPSYSCNSSCENDSQCQTSNSNYKCAETSEGKRCRLKDNEAQTSCTVASTPTPTPTIGCNALCASNADCTNPQHICATTSDGSDRCRLAEYPESQSCVQPGTPVASQPQLPQELPQTGPQDWVNWLKAGLVTLGIGAVLLLLL